MVKRKPGYDHVVDGVYFLKNITRNEKHNCMLNVYRLDLATRSNSSFFLMAKLLLEPLAAFMSSSARHSATVLTFRKAAFLAPVVMSQMAWLTRRIGETSQACRRTEPARPIRVESSRGPPFMMALTQIWTGFSPVMTWMISKACLMIRMLKSFLPLFRPFCMKAHTNRSTIGHCALRNRILLYRAAL